MVILNWVDPNGNRTFVEAMDTTFRQVIYDQNGSGHWVALGIGLFGAFGGGLLFHLVDRRHSR